jgi:hypothetical protein
VSPAIVAMNSLSPVLTSRAKFQPAQLHFNVFGPTLFLAPVFIPVSAGPAGRPLFQFSRQPFTSRTFSQPTWSFPDRQLFSDPLVLFSTFFQLSDQSNLVQRFTSIGSPFQLIFFSNFSTQTSSDVIFHFKVLFRNTNLLCSTSIICRHTPPAFTLICGCFVSLTGRTSGTEFLFPLLFMFTANQSSVAC